jgi:hypothetical protein
VVAVLLSQGDSEESSGKCTNCKSSFTIKKSTLRVSTLIVSIQAYGIVNTAYLYVALVESISSCCPVFMTSELHRLNTLRPREIDASTVNRLLTLTIILIFLVAMQGKKGPAKKEDDDAFIEA